MIYRIANYVRHPTENSITAKVQSLGNDSTDARSKPAYTMGQAHFFFLLGMSVVGPLVTN